jgi:hypothetical protein
MATPALSHVDPVFIAKFSQALKDLRTVFHSPVSVVSREYLKWGWYEYFVHRKDNRLCLRDLEL